MSAAQWGLTTSKCNFTNVNKHDFYQSYLYYHSNWLYKNLQCGNPYKTSKTWGGNLFVWYSWTVKAKGLLVLGDGECLCDLPQPLRSKLAGTSGCKAAQIRNAVVIQEDVASRQGGTSPAQYEADIFSWVRAWAGFVCRTPLLPWVNFSVPKVWKSV